MRKSMSTLSEEEKQKLYRQIRFMKKLDPKYTVEIKDFFIGKIPTPNSTQTSSRMCIIMEKMDYNITKVANDLQPLIKKNPI